MRVHINGELFAECSHLLPERWNGWACPVFTRDQVEAVIEECDRLGWDGEMNENGDPAYRHIGNGEYLLEGWVWEVAE